MEHFERDYKNTLKCLKKCKKKLKTPGKNKRCEKGTGRFEKQMGILYIQKVKIQLMVK